MTDIPLNSIIPRYNRIASVIKETGTEVYLVGGAIRDFLLQRPSSDFDFIVLSDPEGFARRFSNAVSGRLVVLDDKEKTYRVVTEGVEYDFSAPKGSDLASDVRMRDFTINSLAADASFSPSPILSLAGAIEDLSRGVIRATSEGVFRDDPLRLLRAFRFTAVFGFSIDEKTKSEISEQKGLIVRVSRERIRDEFAKLFSALHSYSAILSMDATGLLTVIFPEIAPMKGVIQNRWHTEDVWGHCLLAEGEIEKIMGDPERFFSKRGDQIIAYLGGRLGAGWSRGALLKLVALVHDVGKPERRVVRRDGEFAFYGHENLVEEIFTQVSKRILLNRKAVRFGKMLIKNHMRLLSLSVSEKVTKRAITRLYRDAGDAILGLLILGLADTMAGKADRNRLAQCIRLACEILTVIDDVSLTIVPLLSGTEIMEILDIPEGEIVGRLKADLTLSQTAGEVRSKSGAKAFIQDRVKFYE